MGWGARAPPLTAVNPGLRLPAPNLGTSRKTPMQRAAWDGRKALGSAESPVPLKWSKTLVFVLVLPGLLLALSVEKL